MRVTITGVDERTDVHALPVGPEYAVLVSSHPDGRHRYPADLDTVARLTDALDLAGHPVALHVCGARPRGWLRRGELPLENVSRVQVNGPITLGEVAELTKAFPGHVVITQDSPPNRDLRYSGLANHAILVDGSGGRGIRPAAWSRPDTSQEVGFAGGLSPATLPAELPKIRAVAEGRWWVDMESGVRDADDWLDVDLVRRAARLVAGREVT